jgi:hypothetical protein
MRAQALAHLAGCAACRRELDDAAVAVDELLLLAPEQEPPAGFDARVLTELTQSRPRTAPTTATSPASASSTGAIAEPSESAPARRPRASGHGLRRSSTTARSTAAPGAAQSQARNVPLDSGLVAGRRWGGCSPSTALLLGLIW